MSTIESSVTALKLSYLRFVSDSAPGLVLIGAVLIIERKNLIPYFGDDAALKAFAAAVLILLATPLGLLVNGAGNFCLGGVQEGIERRCFTAKSWPLKDTHKVLLIDRWKTYFKMQNGDWPRVVYEVDDLLEMYVPLLATSLDHVRALKRFSRSIGFIAMAGLFVAAGEYGAWAVVAILVGMATSLVRPRWQRCTRFMSGLFVLEAAVLVATGCWWLQPATLTVSLVLIAVGAIVLAGFVDFYQHGLTMLFVYQLLAKDDDGFEISAARVRDGLSVFVQSRAPQKGG